MLNKFIAVSLCIILCVSPLFAAPSGGRSSPSGMRSSPPVSRPSIPSRPSTPAPSRSAPSGIKPSVPHTPATPKTPATPATPHAPDTSRSSPSGVKPVQQAKTTPTKSVVDNKVNKMVKVGNTSLPKEQAISKFQKEHASTYTSKYTSQPSSRPSHIPQTYNNHTVIYNHGYGGYGYYGPSGAWIMYDAMRDAAMMSILMNNHGYRDVVVTSPQVVTTDGTVVNQPVVIHRGPTIFGTLVGVFCLLFLILLIVVIFKDR